MSVGWYLRPHVAVAANMQQHSAVRALIWAALCAACACNASHQHPVVLQRALSLLRDSSTRYLQDLEQLVAFPTISASPAHWPAIREAAQWLAVRLEHAGLEAQVLDTDGPQPVVYAQWDGAPGKPTVLIYGHYDVQPVDPLDEWLSDPFKVTVKDGCVYGRGVDDDKGPLLMAIQAVEALLQASVSKRDHTSTQQASLPVNVKFLLEGQEEVLSPNLRAFMQRHKGLLAADLALSADGRQASESLGAILLGLRGIVGLQVDVVTAATDMHSGLKGGSVPNANHVLAGMLAGLRDPLTGRVLVQGFYEGVAEMTQEDKEDVERYPFDEASERARLGVNEVHGEEGFTTLERRWHRPTLEVVGMQGGFTGEGIKTVIPRLAFAKVSCRLVPGQQPDDVFRKVRSHLLAAAPGHANVSVTQLGGGSVAWSSERGASGNRAAAKVLEEVMGKPPVFQRDGGTIPALTELQHTLALPTTVFAWGLGEGIHAPNERLKLTMFEKGREAWARLLWGLGASHVGHDEL